MRLHVCALPHTETTDDFSWCAFTSLCKTFATMMTRQGHTVILYGGQENEAEVAEFVTCHDAVSKSFNVPPWTQEYFAPMNKRVIKAMKKRVQPGDLILFSMGVVNLPIAEAFPDNVTCEYIVGHGGPTAPARVFPSEAWRHIIYGHYAENVMVIRGMCTDAVIPHFLEPEAFPAGKGGDYLLFIGRLGSLKGEEVAVQMAEKTGLPLKVVGAGPVPSLPKNGEYLGTVHPKERAELLGGALAVITPSMFPEPFCLVAVEAQMCGTPVISTDWGAFTETVPNGVAGYRCSTLDEFVRATKRVEGLDRTLIRERALHFYSTGSIGPQYTRFFRRLHAIYPDHVD